MLDVSLRNLGFTYPKSGFALRGITIAFEKSTHTAIVGPPSCGATTLLRLVAGTLQPDEGEIAIGARLVNGVKAARRPLLFATSAIDAPPRWSVQHALIAAVRKRTLDRQDRELEYDLAVAKWRLEKLVTRRLDTLSTAEQTLAHLASIELLRPGILVADRLLERLPEASDDFYRTMRVIGTTVISAPASHGELGTTNAIAVLESGRLIQTGSIAEVFAKPASEAAAAATGDANVIPIEIRGTVVESPIGAWDVAGAPFQGTG
ncbi:MAG: ABC transporter ATP-binding protein, partial [Thermoanaerobaculia bacterium]|nr:ABC transporter ATP-binding protein [Thermoanaerobaculia bacterium]